VKLRALLTPFESFRNNSGVYILIHRHGEYQYRSPDSVYVHRFEWFSTLEDAETYLAERIAKVEQSEWQIFEQHEEQG